MNLVSVKLCGCDGEKDHDEFPEGEYTFPDGTKEILPVLCLENEIYPEDLYYEFYPVLKTLESDEEWTMFACYAGQIAEIRPELYFYSFGDIDEIGERNFYIQGGLESVVDMLLEEWGPQAPGFSGTIRHLTNDHFFSKGESIAMILDFEKNAAVISV
jgi:hypothetical protein